MCIVAIYPQKVMVVADSVCVYFFFAAVSRTLFFGEARALTQTHQADRYIFL